jgi:asparaginyl-tRNA synthetase
MTSCIVLSKELAKSPYHRVKDIWEKYESLVSDKTQLIIRGQSVTVRSAKAGKLFFVELCDGSTVRTIQSICDSTVYSDVDWMPLFEQCTRGCTVELTGHLVPSPAPEQPIEFMVTGYQILGLIDDPEKYPLAGRGYISRAFLRQIPEKRQHTQLFLALQIVKQESLKAIQIAMSDLGIGKVLATLFTSNECEGGAFPFKATILEPTDVTKDGLPDYSKDFFGKPVYLSVSSQLHLEATVLGSKRDGYCETTACRAEPSESTIHAAAFLMHEWELIGGGIERNMAVAQTVLQTVYQRVLDECPDELSFLQDYQLQEMIEEDSGYKKEIITLKEKMERGTVSKKVFSKESIAIKIKYKTTVTAPSLIDKIKRYAVEPYVVTTHQECVRQIRDAVQKGDISEDMLLDYGDDLSRLQEYWICDTIGRGMPVFVKYFPKKIKAFYMPILKEDTPCYDSTGDMVEHVDCYDMLVPGIGEVIGGSQRIDDALVLVDRMKELDMDLEELDWYIGLRRDASMPHGGAGLGFGRLMVSLTGVHNIKDHQDFPRAHGTAFKG